MSLPVRTTSGPEGIEDGMEDAPEPARGAVVDIRLMGPPEAVADVVRRLGSVVRVAGDRGEFPRRRGLGIRRYLTVIATAGERSL